MSIQKLTAAAAVAAALVAAPALANCRISNETGTSFTVASGNTTNQTVGRHTTTSIAAGTIIAKGDNGKTVSGSCRDGEQMKIVEKSGVPVIVPK